jgi:hypothetical protein
MQIREYIDTDWQSVWPIFREVVTAGDTFAYDPGWSSEQDQSVWVEATPGRTVVACDGPRVLGTAKIGPNRPGPGSHVSTASFMVSGDARGRGSDERSASTRSLGLVSKGTPRCSSTPLWNRTTFAVRLWQTLGFRIIGTVPEAFEHPTLGRVGLHVMHRRL